MGVRVGVVSDYRDARRRTVPRDALINRENNALLSVEEEHLLKTFHGKAFKMKEEDRICINCRADWETLWRKLKQRQVQMVLVVSERFKY